MPLRGLAHSRLTFDRSRAKPASPEYLYSIFTVTTQRTWYIFLYISNIFGITMYNHLNPLLSLARTAGKSLTITCDKCLV